MLDSNDCCEDDESLLSVDREGGGDSDGASRAIIGLLPCRRRRLSPMSLQLWAADEHGNNWVRVVFLFLSRSDTKFASSRLLGDVRGNCGPTGEFGASCPTFCEEGRRRILARVSGEACCALLVLSLLRHAPDMGCRLERGGLGRLVLWDLLYHSM